MSSERGNKDKKERNRNTEFWLSLDILKKKKKKKKMI